MPANWEPFLAFEGIQGSVDKNTLHTVQATYYVPTRAMAMSWVPPDLEKEFGIPIYGPRQWSQEWGNGRLVKMNRDGAFKVVIQLQGVEDPKEEETGVTFDADGTMSEEPLDIHPGLDFLLERYDGQINDGKIEFQQQLEVDGKTVKNPMFGANKWLVPGVTWTKQYVTKRPRGSVTEMLGKVCEPPRAPDGYLPQLAGRRNWLKIVGKPSWRGNVWKVTESWQMSADGGWVKDLYK